MSEDRTEGRTARKASSFGPNTLSFVWYPYLPVGDYSVLMAGGGTGKTVLCCGIAAAVSAGKALPGDEFQGQGRNVLIVSAEDTGEILRERLEKSGADLEKVFILDASDSIGMNFSAGYADFEATVKAYSPALVIVDPWHGFLGASVDVNRVNAVRPVFQQLANLAKVCHCAIILVSHVNKRAQGENANNAATGSTDLINASRSAFQVIFDEENEDCRILVHTKTNYAAYGKSVRYRIWDGGIEWAGFSDITRQTLEKAARRRETPGEVIQSDSRHTAANAALINALEDVARKDGLQKYTYTEFQKRYGQRIFGGGQPRKALERVEQQLREEGYFLRTARVRGQEGKPGNGFEIQRIESVPTLC